MKCHEFQRLWQELLDDRSPGGSDLDRSLERHAASCEPCRAITARFQVLRQAIAVMGPPMPSVESRERLQSLRVPIAVARCRPIWPRRVLIPLATAAALLALAWIGEVEHRGPAEPGRTTVPFPRTSVPCPLETALADASRVTIELAREASAPAARISREALDLNNLGRVPTPNQEPPPTAASDLLQSVGQRVNASVQPISGSARHAFSFLLGAPPEPTLTPTTAPTDARDGL